MVFCIKIHLKAEPNFKKYCKNEKKNVISEITEFHNEDNNDNKLINIKVEKKVIENSIISKTKVRF